MKIHTTKIRRAAAVGVAVVSMMAAAASTALGDDQSSKLVRSQHEIRSMADLPPHGTWVPYSVGEESSASSATLRTNQVLVPPVARPCPPGKTNYPAPNERFNCMAFYADNGNIGHPVLLRQGAAGDFGYLHAFIDHGLDEETIAYVIVNNAAGQRQPNGRFLYGLRYKVAGVGLIAVEVYEQRESHENFNDGEGLGVVTVFCPGFDGHCPEGINESIP